MADPKLLEAYFRFMAEAMKQQGQAKDFFEAFQKATSPEAWATFLQKAAPDIQGMPDMSMAGFQSLSESYWRALGFVPRLQYDELETKYLELKEKLEVAEREAERLKSLLSGEQQERAKEAIDAWTEAIQGTLEAQTKWWSSWLGKKDTEP
jgi:hypothetical protein